MKIFTVELQLMIVYVYLLSNWTQKIQKKNCYLYTKWGLNWLLSMMKHLYSLKTKTKKTVCPRTKKNLINSSFNFPYPIPISDSVLDWCMLASGVQYLLVNISSVIELQARYPIGFSKPRGGCGEGAWSPRHFSSSNQGRIMLNSKSLGYA